MLYCSYSQPEVGEKIIGVMQVVKFKDNFLFRGTQMPKGRESLLYCNDKGGKP